MKISKFIIHTFKFPGQFGTHIDFPAHFIKDGKTSEHYGAEQLMFPLCVIDVTEKVKEDYEEKTKENRFPNYKSVVSNNESSNQEVKLDNKAITEKLKEMKKEGKYSDNKSPQIALNFEDGKVMLDGVQIGTADGVKFDSDTQRMVVNAKYLKDALTYGETSKVFVSSDPSKAMVVKTETGASMGYADCNGRCSICFVADR